MTLSLARQDTTVYNALLHRQFHLIITSFCELTYIGVPVFILQLTEFPISTVAYTF